ncbi:MAG: DUF4198 domain-containing protein [Deltaproteobacteria bacterium]|jgi:cobalt/nickel transport protein|nr:DUF4198 domain-containing protein [Deltaproteobacteria bacterium]
MKKSFFLLAVLVILAPVPAWAHFGMLIPSVPTVMDSKDSTVTMDAKFWHPFENNGMDLVKPKSFQVYQGDQAADLLPSLKETKLGDHTTWRLSYKIERPGLYKFVMEPEPYWEPAEDCFIVHYTKVYVDAFGDDDGWNEPTPGLKTEIVPLIKPGGLYAGNTFVGRVLLDGQSAKNSEVEIEWYPGPGKAGQAPYESMVPQTVMTDEQGLFFYTPPTEGWWGFAGLNTADYKLPQEGQQKDVELGAVLWLYFHKFRDATAGSAE